MTSWTLNKLGQDFLDGQYEHFTLQVNWLFKVICNLPVHMHRLFGLRLALKLHRFLNIMGQNQNQFSKMIKISLGILSFLKWSKSVYRVFKLAKMIKRNNVFFQNMHSYFNTILKLWMITKSLNFQYIYFLLSTLLCI